MNEVLLYIHNHLCDNLTCAQIAHDFGYSTAHFCVKFHHFTGRSFLEYVRHFRMQHALADILEGETVTDTAIRYGYDSVSGFSKAFLGEFGCAPRYLIKQNRDRYLQYQERRMKMVKLTDRCFILRDDAMKERSQNHIIEPQHNIWNQVSLHDLPQDASLTRAIGHRIRLLAENFPTVIRDMELIVGDNFGVREYAKVGPEMLADDAFLTGVGLQQSQIDFIRDRMQKPGVEFTRTQIACTPQQKRLQDDWAAIGRVIDSNHSVVGYQKILELGFEGIMQQVQELAQLHPENKDMYDAAVEICQGGCVIGERYAEKAEQLAKEAGPERKEELLSIARTCRQVPRYPATNLQEAVQSLWFAHIFNTWEDWINANSLGRLDQILYPYYRKDMDNGRLQESDVYELIGCLWIKLYRDYDVQQSCVGGCDANGESAVNRLSYIMLDVTEQLDFIRCLSVRFSQKTDPAFLRRALEVVGHVGKGVPFFFNDDVMIPALVDAGISLEDARDYTQIGCVETVIPGKSNPHAVAGETNLLKALEYALFNGRSLVLPEGVYGLENGSYNQFTTYAKLEEAVYAQVLHILDAACQRISDLCAGAQTRPYKSMLTQGCMESGRDFNYFGSKYDYYQIMLGGIPNLADSLAVLKKFVYEEKKYTLAHVVEQMQQDYPDERLRQEFINKAPKYGNDIDEVDTIAVEITNRCCDMLKTLSQKYGLKFHAQPFTYWWMVDHGRTTGASPDGRKKGEIIAYSASPMQGRDFSGLIALLNSICKLPTKRTPGTTSAIVEVDPKLFNDNNIDRITDVLMVAAKKGLSNVQFNTVSVDTLLDARENPQNHANLAVRVSGFSQKFNLLSPKLQDHIIERTKHQCL